MFEVEFFKSTAELLNGSFEALILFCEYRIGEVALDFLNEFLADGLVLTRTLPLSLQPRCAPARTHELVVVPRVDATRARVWSRPSRQLFAPDGRPTCVVRGGHPSPRGHSQHSAMVAGVSRASSW